MQPVFLPWLGYFEQMALCDEFMFLDDVQYTKRDWRNRNRIRTKDGWIWLTIPIQKANADHLMCEIRINWVTQCSREHLSTLATNYKPCPYFEEIYTLIEESYAAKPEYLIDLTMQLIKAIAEYLDIAPEYSVASDITKHADGKEQRIVELLQARKEIGRAHV